MKKEFKHIGVARRSGRYPWGSGDDPYQRASGFLGYVKELKDKGIKLSFSAFLTHVFAKTVAEHPYMQAMKWGRRKMVVFEDVDASFLVEREVKGKKMPTMVMIRQANKKTIQEITNDLWGAASKKDESMVDKDRGGGSATDKLLKMPRFLRRILFNIIMKNPFLHRKFKGTVGMTSIGLVSEQR